MKDYRELLNPRVAQVPPSGIRKFFDIAQKLPDCISLGMGDTDFISPNCTDAINRATAW